MALSATAVFCIFPSGRLLTTARGKVCRLLCHVERVESSVSQGLQEATGSDLTHWLEAQDKGERDLCFVAEGQLLC